MTPDDTNPGTRQEQWTARLDDIGRRFANIARVHADALERTLAHLDDKSRECEQLKERVRMAEENARRWEECSNAWEECSNAFERERDDARRRLAEEEQEVELKRAALTGAYEDRNAALERVAVLEAALRKQLMEPACWQDEDAERERDHYQMRAEQMLNDRDAHLRAYNLEREAHAATRAEMVRSLTVQPANWIRREEYDRACADRDEARAALAKAEEAYEHNKREAIRLGNWAEELSAKLQAERENHAATSAERDSWKRVAEAEVECNRGFIKDRDEARAALAKAEEVADEVRDQRDQAQARLRAIDLTLDDGIEGSKVQSGEYAYTHELGRVRGLITKLARAEEENARLKTQANRIADERDRNIADKVSTSTALGRAVAALQGLMPWANGEPVFNGDLAAHTAARAAADAVLADADGKAAGEAWRMHESLLSEAAQLAHAASMVNLDDAARSSALVLARRIDATIAARRGT